MENSHSPLARIVAAKNPAKTQSRSSKGQKLFARLVKKIDAQKKLLQQWQDVIPLYHQKSANEYEPLVDAFNQHRIEMVYLLDKAYADKAFNKLEKKKLKKFIASMAAELIAEHGDSELKLIYNKYSGSNFDDEAAEVNEVMKLMMSAALGVDIDDDIDINSTEEMVRHLDQKLKQKFTAQGAYQQAQPGKQKKSAKTIAKEAKQLAESQNAKQSIREIYRKLVGALHPDREQDASERERKTALMQRINVAYGKKDLLQLLELQLEVEQMDESMIHSVSEERLKHYNKVLTEQSAELEDELHVIEFSFGTRANLSPFIHMTPTMMLAELDADIGYTNLAIAEIKNDLNAFRDVKEIKAFLKDYRLRQQDFAEPDVFGEMDFGAVFGKGRR